MTSLISKILYLFDTRERVKIVLIFGLMLGGAALEVLGIGVILPIIAMLANPDGIRENAFLAQVYDWIAPTSVNVFIIWACAGMLGVYVLKNGYLFFTAYIQARFMYNKNLILSSRLFRSYLYRPYTFHLQRNTAQLLRNLQLILSVVTGVFFSMIIIVSECTVVIAIFVFLVWHDSVTSVVAFVVLSAVVASFLFMVRNKLRNLGEVQKYHIGQLIQQVNQGLGSIKETKVLGKEEYFDRSYHNHLKKVTHTYQFQNVINQAPRFYIETVMISLILLLLVFSLYIGREPQAIFLTLSLYAIAAVRLMPSMARISGAMTQIRFFTPGLEEVYEDLIDCEDVFPNHSSENGQTPFVFKRQIDLKNVTYQYENAIELAIKEVSLSILRRQSVGFVGSSGAGKTTVVDVLLGLLNPTKGKVLVDGQNIKENLSSWQRQIGYIPQSIYLSDDTIQGNVAFGLSKEEIEEEKVWTTLRLAQLEEFVLGLPDQLETYIGEHGIRISGGQRQRIGIARALYHEPELLVMDEATAALDNETERAFMEAIEKLSGEKTIILIAHRLSTVKNCDVIYFFKDGHLLSSGSYNKLFDNCHEFHQMAIAGKPPSFH